MDDKPANTLPFFYFIAAVVLLPLGWWVKANFTGDVGYFILSLGGLIY